MSQPFKLYRLQQIDSHIDQALGRLREIEVALNDKTALNEARQRNADGSQPGRCEERFTSRKTSALAYQIETGRFTVARFTKRTKDLQNESAT
jgi:hypothetical protein